MKKLLSLIVGCLSVSPVFADMGSLSDQFKAALTKDMVAVFEHTSHNEDKGLLATSLIQFGHYQNDYILAGDVGTVIDKSINASYGVHFHITPFLLKNIPMNPDLASFLSHVEITPRYSYDEDVKHGVLSYIFGAKVSFGGVQGQ